MTTTFACVGNCFGKFKEHCKMQTTSKWMTIDNILRKVFTSLHPKKYLQVKCYSLWHDFQTQVDNLPTFNFNLVANSFQLSKESIRLTRLKIYSFGKSHLISRQSTSGQVIPFDGYWKLLWGIGNIPWMDWSITLSKLQNGKTFH